MDDFSDGAPSVRRTMWTRKLSVPIPKPDMALLTEGGLALPWIYNHMAIRLRGLALPWSINMALLTEGDLVLRWTYEHGRPYGGRNK